MIWCFVSLLILAFALGVYVGGQLGWRRAVYLYRDRAVDTAYDRAEQDARRGWL